MMALLFSEKNMKAENLPMYLVSTRSRVGSSEKKELRNGDNKYNLLRSFAIKRNIRGNYRRGIGG